MKINVSMKAQIESEISHYKNISSQYDTCDIKLNLHCDLIGQSRVSEQLMGFLQSAIFSRDPVNGQQPVPNLQQPAPPHRNKT